MYILYVNLSNCKTGYIQTYIHTDIHTYYIHINLSFTILCTLYYSNNCNSMVHEIALNNKHTCLKKTWYLFNYMKLVQMLVENSKFWPSKSTFDWPIKVWLKKKFKLDHRPRFFYRYGLVTLSNIKI